MEESKFVKIACPKCGKKTMIFGKATVEVKCSSCSHLLNKSRGGKTKIRAKVKEVI
jgi:ribosomal protein S27E